MLVLTNRTLCLVDPWFPEDDSSSAGDDSSSDEDDTSSIYSPSRLEDSLEEEMLTTEGEK